MPLLSRCANCGTPPKKIKTSSIPHWGVRNPCRDVRGSHFSTLMTADSVEDRPSCRQARERARSCSLGAQTYSVPSGKRPNQPAAEIRASLRSRHSRALFHSKTGVGSWPNVCPKRLDPGNTPRRRLRSAYYHEYRSTCLHHGRADSQTFPKKFVSSLALTLVFVGHTTAYTRSGARRLPHEQLRRTREYKREVLFS